jgi:hypothetical protein
MQGQSCPRWSCLCCLTWKKCSTILCRPCVDRTMHTQVQLACGRSKTARVRSRFRHALHGMSPATICQAWVHYLVTWRAERYAAAWTPTLLVSEYMVLFSGQHSVVL